MTDDMRPCVRKALIDLQDTWAIDGEQGEHIAELLNDAYNDGANDARTWRPLTEDPATWPEEGQWVLLRSAAVKDGPDLQRWFAHRRSQATRCSSWARPAHWTHWAPLPAPPEQETR